MGTFKASIPFSSFMLKKDIKTLNKMNKLCKETFHKSDLVKWEEICSKLVQELMLRGKLSDLKNLNHK